MISESSLLPIWLPYLEVPSLVKLSMTNIFFKEVILKAYSKKIDEFRIETNNQRWQNLHIKCERRMKYDLRATSGVVTLIAFLNLFIVTPAYSAISEIGLVWIAASVSATLAGPLVNAAYENKIRRALLPCATEQAARKLSHSLSRDSFKILKSEYFFEYETLRCRQLYFSGFISEEASLQLLNLIQACKCNLFSAEEAEQEWKRLKAELKITQYLPFPDA